MIDAAEADIQFSLDIIQTATKSGDSSLVSLNFGLIIQDKLKVGLLHWRQKKSPITAFRQALRFSNEAFDTLSKMGFKEALDDEMDLHETIYAAYLIGEDHPAVNLEAVGEHVLASAFFGNVLIGAADIADWPKYRDAIPNEKRYHLARRSNELYADLLAGRISPEKGIPLAEKLWEEREDNHYFDTGCEGGGGDTDIYVDYRLGAILKKIGSTVPTIHAWVW